MNPLHQIAYARALRVSNTFYAVDQAAPLMRVPKRVIEIFQPFHETALPTLMELREKLDAHPLLSFTNDSPGLALVRLSLAGKVSPQIQSMIGEVIADDAHLVAMIDGALTLFEGGLKQMKIRAVTSTNKAEKVWLAVAEFLFLRGVN